MKLDDIKAPPKSPMKQRSFYMDDETYALIERHAEKLGASNGTALRMIIRAELLDEQPAPVKLIPYPELSPTGAEVLEHVERVKQVVAETTGVLRSVTSAAAGVLVPPASQETFKVPEHMKEKHQRAPRPIHVDDDF